SIFANNRETGTKGCLATTTIEDRDIMSNFIRTHKPTHLIVNSSTSTPTPTPPTPIVPPISTLPTDEVTHSRRPNTIDKIDCFCLFIAYDEGVRALFEYIYNNFPNESLDEDRTFFTYLNVLSPNNTPLYKNSSRIDKTLSLALGGKVRIIVFEIRSEFIVPSFSSRIDLSPTAINDLDNVDSIQLSTEQEETLKNYYEQELNNLQRNIIERIGTEVLDRNLEFRYYILSSNVYYFLADNNKVGWSFLIDKFYLLMKDKFNFYKIDYNITNNSESSPTPTEPDPEPVDEGEEESVDEGE
ncbi:hypothetical protein V6O07_23645, partial [Arthrospira platensis SPKY2]